VFFLGLLVVGFFGATDSVFCLVRFIKGECVVNNYYGKELFRVFRETKVNGKI
jgi:hypothetical protein